MANYRRPKNDFDDDLAFGELPPNRWDLDRFNRERDRLERAPRTTEVIVEERSRGRDQDRRHHDSPSPERFVSRVRREAFDPNYGEIDNDRALQHHPREEVERERERDIIIDIERGYRPAPPNRPAVIRRQSSLDTFDRRPSRGYVKEVYTRRSPSPEERIRYESPPAPAKVREVEIVRETEVTTRSKGKGDARSVASGPRSVLSQHSRHSRAASSSGSSSVTSRGTSPPALPGKKGYTRLPKGRFTRVAIERFGVTYTDEPDSFKIHRALDKESIDQILEWSFEREPTRRTTYKYDGGKKDDHYEAIRTEWINPPSTRAPSLRAPSPPRSSRRSRAPSAPPPPREEININVQQGPPPPPATQYMYPPPQPQWVPPPPQQPMTIAVTQQTERSHEDITDEIRRLEIERDLIRQERGFQPVTNNQVFVSQPWQQQQIQPIPNAYQIIPWKPRSRSVDREIIKVIEREKSPKRDVVRLAKDKKGRLALVRSKR